MSRPLRILHVCPRPSFSGLEAYAFSMAEAQARLGHTIEFLTLENSPLEKKVTDAGFKTHRLARDVFAKPRMTAHLFSFLNGADKPDIVHLHSTQDINLFLAPLASTRASNTRPKVVLQIHIWISHSKKDPLHAIAYSLIDELWCSSEPAKQTIERFVPIAPSKIRIVRYGREIEKIQHGFLSRSEARHALGLSESATVIGAVARVDKGKGTKELLDAVLELTDSHPDLSLVWIGPPTSDDPKAVAFAKDIADTVANLPEGLRKRILFPGAIPESYRLLRAFDLFALPTYSECFALSLLEAQLAELPTLGTNAGGTPEVVKPDQTGWLFEPRSTESAKAAIEKALSQRSQWSTFGTNAERLVTKHHNFSRILPETVVAYRELVH